MRHYINTFLLGIFLYFYPHLTYAINPTSIETTFFTQTLNALTQGKITWQQALNEPTGKRLQEVAQYRVFQITLENTLKKKQTLSKDFLTELDTWLKKAQDPYLKQSLAELAIPALHDLKQYTDALHLERYARHTHAINCYLLSAKIQTHQLSELEASNEIKKHFKPTNACLNLIQENTIMPTSWLIQELWSAIELQHPKTRNTLLNILITPDIQSDWIAIKKDPLSWIKTHKHQAKTSFLYRLALQQWILKNKKLTYKNIQPWVVPLSPKDREEVIAYAGLVLALNLEPEAYTMYQQLPKNKALKTYNQEWRIRVALRQEKRNWGMILHLIEQLPQDIQNKSNWLYWKALAQKQTKKPFNQTVHQLITHHRDYYALLARESFNKPLNLSSTKNEKEPTISWKPNAHLEKGVLLYSLGMPRLAQGEWHYGLAPLDQQEQLKAAYWADQAGAYILSINTSVRLGQQGHFHISFPAPQKDLLVQEAQHQEVEESFVYGLIRQESRFITQIASTVGAQGLMQIMPATAKDIIKKNQFPKEWAQELHQAHINAVLGIRYIQMMKNQFNQRYPLIAIAYNAGPHRAKTWSNKVPHHLPGSIFIESIPFSETRHYVQNVLANMVYYQYKFHNTYLNLHDLIGSFEKQ